MLKLLKGKFINFFNIQPFMGIIDFKEILSKKLLNKEMPNHLALATMNFSGYDEKKAIEKHIALLNELIEFQIKTAIPIFTIHLRQTPEEYKKYLASYIKSLEHDETISKNQVRIFIIGKWYDLEQDAVEAIKSIMEATKDYDKHFLNLCVNYDGQEEILGSLKLMARKIQMEKMNFEELSKEVIKDNLYTSYFIPPDLMIETGYQFSGLLLWDSQGAVLHFTRKHWLEFDKKDLEQALERFVKSKS
ncbi:hypothetical protein C4573_03040 [Candidatus Woesearchaeota archaeon]|nr:MAG: hypothetical protein C4573_03040 [Candidatus Woesearchaeota archaeon]